MGNHLLISAFYIEEKTMKFFIAMQNELYEQQFNQQILSCSQKDPIGNVPHYYARMTELSKGDKIFHYSNGNIVAIGTIVKPTISVFHEANNYFFEAKIQYDIISTPLHVRTYWDEVKMLLPAAYAAFQKNGHDNGGFLYPCNENLACLFMEKIALLNSDEPILQEILETEAKVQATMRIGHQHYKNKLLHLWHHECAICKINIPELLKASHAKPWRDATHQERLDPYNGLLLCAHHDALFDKGFISFNECGEILLSPVLIKAEPSIYGVNANMRIQLYEENLKYLLWHQSYVFKNNR